MKLSDIVTEARKKTQTAQQRAAKKTQAARQRAAKRTQAAQQPAAQQPAAQQPAAQAPAAQAPHLDPSIPINSEMPGNQAGEKFVYSSRGWSHVVGGDVNPVSDNDQAALLSSQWHDRNSQAPAAAAPGDTAPAATPRLEDGTKTNLYGKPYTYNSAQNRWIDSANRPARGLAHTKLMDLNNSDPYGRQKPEKKPGLMTRVSNAMGGKFGQGIDPDAGMTSKVMGTVGSMVGRGVDAMVRKRAASQAARTPAPAPTATAQAPSAPLSLAPLNSSLDLSRLKTLAGIK